MVSEKDKKIADIRSRYSLEEQSSSSSSMEVSEDSRKSAQAGSQFLANVFAGAFIGYGVDWFFDTLPWGLIVFICLGFVTGVYNANAQMQKKNEENMK